MKIFPAWTEDKELTLSLINQPDKLASFFYRTPCSYTDKEFDCKSDVGFTFTTRGIVWWYIQNPNNLSSYETPLTIHKSYCLKLSTVRVDRKTKCATL